MNSIAKFSYLFLIVRFSVIVYALGYCDNCSKIIMDGIRRNNDEALCKRMSDNLIIAGKIPRVFEVISFVARRNGSDMLRPRNCDCDIFTLICNCSNLTAAKNDGKYSVHIILDTMALVRNGSRTLEWCSNNVTVTVQSKTWSNTLAIYIAN